MSRKLFNTAPAPTSPEAITEYLGREFPRIAGEITWDPDRVVLREISATVTMLLVLSDIEGGLVKGNNSITSVFVVDPTATVAWPLGARIELAQWGAGECQVSGSGSATIQVRTSANLAGQYAKAELIHVETDIWLLSGDLA